MARKVIAVARRGARKQRKPRSAGIERRKAILVAALSVFADQGFDGASTRAIAAAAGVEQGHLAYYFESKAALWREVVRTHNAAITEVVDSALRDAASRPAATVAMDVVSLLLAQFAANPAIVRLMLQEFSVASPRHDWVVAEVGRPLWIRLKPLFRTLHGQGHIAGSNPAFAYLAIMGGALLFFGSQPEVRAIATLNPATKANSRAFINFLIRSVILRGERAASGAAR